MDGENAFEEWMILELLGHIRLAGRVTEAGLFGGKMGRIDIPVDDGFVTQFFGPGAIFRMTPVSEETARMVAVANRPAPIKPYEMPAVTTGLLEDRGGEDGW